MKYYVIKNKLDGKYFNSIKGDWTSAYHATLYPFKELTETAVEYWGLKDAQVVTWKVEER